MFFFILVFSFFPDILSIIAGVFLFHKYHKIERFREDGYSFDQPGSCSILYFNCTTPTITLFSGGLVRAVELWDKVPPEYFCGIPSSTYLPCWWSQDPRFLTRVRMGPVQEEIKALLYISIVLMVIGGFAVCINIFAAMLRCGVQGNGLISRWMHGGRPVTQGLDRGGEIQGEGGVIVIQDPTLREEYPMTNINWMNGVVTRNPFADRRLAILTHFFEVRRKRAERAERETQPFGFDCSFTSESEHDDDDIPVDECYVCLSHFRRRMIWWPCGHWICASCARKVLRRSPSQGVGCCPNCRGVATHEELLVLHLQSASEISNKENNQVNENNNNRNDNMEVQPVSNEV